MAKDIKCDTIDENTADAGVTIEGLQLVDSILKTDTISEKTSEVGVTIDSVFNKDGHVILPYEIVPISAVANKVMLYSKSDEELYIKGDDSVNKKLISVPSTVHKSIFFTAPFAIGGSLGDFKVLSIGASSSNRFTFNIPPDFVTLQKLVLIYSAASGANGSGKNIDLTSDYGAISEQYNNHSESDTSSTYTIEAVGEMAELNISGVFSSIAAGDYCGLLVSHSAIGGSIDYLGTLLEYL